MPAASIQPAIAGATGYTGFELARLLLDHPYCKLPLLLQTRDDDARELAETYPQLAGKASLPLRPFSWESVRGSGANVLFLCVPHELSREMVPQAVGRGVRVIDLSGAWRLQRAEHRTACGFRDAGAPNAALDGSAVYGIPELHASDIANAAVVANAGCYATSIILALVPWLRAGLVDRQRGIVCDSKSGVSGAGKQPTAKTHFVEVSGNLAAYSVFGHRHTGEILEQLDLQPGELQFTPHLLPIPRGILSTIYLRAVPGLGAAELEHCLREFYADAVFVRVFPCGSLPQIRYSLHTNHCDIGFCFEPETRRVVLVSCLDNLIKGASGQAVQNMNVMFGWAQGEGLA